MGSCWGHLDHGLLVGKACWRPDWSNQPQLRWLSCLHSQCNCRSGYFLFPGADVRKFTLLLLLGSSPVSFVVYSLSSGKQHFSFKISIFTFEAKICFSPPNFRGLREWVKRQLRLHNVAFKVTGVFKIVK